MVSLSSVSGRNFSQMVISKTELARRLKEIRTRKPTIGSDEGEQIASDSHLKRKRTSNDATGSVPQPSKNLNPEGSCLGKKSSVWDKEFDFSKFRNWGVDQLCGGTEEYLRKAVGLMCLANLKAKENANAEKKREKQLHNLQQEVDQLQADASKREKQLRDLQQEVAQLQAKLSNEKSILYLQRHQMKKEMKLKDEELYELREKKAQLTKSIQDLNVKEAEWKETEESLKNEIAISFGSGFDAALEQVAVLHPTIDLFKTDLCKVEVNGKLVKEEAA